MTAPRWGVTATVKAPPRAVLGFAAHHLDLGAHRVFVYLDAEAPETEARLAAHPKLRVFRTDDDWWQKRGGRPAKHQERQTRNLRHALDRRAEVDWLAHIDVDEFLWPRENSVAEELAALPDDCLCARTRPLEALAEPSGGPPVHFKAFHLDRTRRQQAAARVFPTWGRDLPGGFLSHVAGKLFLRTGHGLRARIHNAWLGEEQNPGERPLPCIELCHLHAPDWETWIGQYRYRLKAGAYRAELTPQAGPGSRNLTVHALLSEIEAAAGEDGLRAFFEEVCTATPERLAALAREGLLRRCDLDLDARIARHLF
ncbi:glycosyltransferase family 2 protein [Rhodosalinus sp. K401]|uniref:glycosyltransferase family 2 protein n=1 Tax=Rhodosalinus sp. K401 TaxID=3239195 RepID=UPI00352395CB